MAFNLNELAKKDSFELHLRHPVTDELLYADEDKAQPVKIVLFGTSSKQYRNALAVMQNNRLKRNKKVMTAEVMKEDSIDLLVACSDKTINLEYMGQNPVQGDMFHQLYSDDSFDWLKDQCDEAIGDTANFLDKPKTI
jgi:hypothetical protein